MDAKKSKDQERQYLVALNSTLKTHVANIDVSMEPWWVIFDSSSRRYAKWQEKNILIF